MLAGATRISVGQADRAHWRDILLSGGKVHALTQLAVGTLGRTSTETLFRQFEIARKGFALARSPTILAVIAVGRQRMAGG